MDSVDEAIVHDNVLREILTAQCLYVIDRLFSEFLNRNYGFPPDVRTVLARVLQRILQAFLFASADETNQL